MNCSDLRSYRGIFVSDLDGTLLDTQARISTKNQQAFDKLGQHGILRIIATGRSLHSVNQCLPDNFPVDYVILSTGSHLMDWTSKKNLLATSFTSASTSAIWTELYRMRTNFMAHGPIPENHRFYFWQTADDVPDFSRRLQLYAPWAKAAANCPSDFAASQFLVIAPREKYRIIEHIRAVLSHCSIITATSPLDHESWWIEIFPSQVSKATGVFRIQDCTKTTDLPVGAVGNDFNDQDMLEYAHFSYRVENATFGPDDRYISVPANTNHGVAFAIEDYLQRKSVKHKPC